MGHMPDLFEEQRSNLRTLAAYLRTLPADYPDFEMGQFCRDGRGSAWDEAHFPACGTAACAVGHGPAAGIPPLSGEDWREKQEIEHSGAVAWAERAELARKKSGE